MITRRHHFDGFASRAKDPGLTTQNVVARHIPLPFLVKWRGEIPYPQQKSSAEA